MWARVPVWSYVFFLFFFLMKSKKSKSNVFSTSQITMTLFCNKNIIPTLAQRMLKPHQRPVAPLGTHCMLKAEGYICITLNKCPFKSNKCLPLPYVVLPSPELEKVLLCSSSFRNFGKTWLAFGSVVFGWHDCKATSKNRLLSPWWLKHSSCFWAASSYKNRALHSVLINQVQTSIKSVHFYITVTQE